MRPARRGRAAALLAAVLLLAVACGLDARPFELSDVARITSLSDPQPAPDGRHVALIVSTPDLATDTNRRVLELVDAKTGARRALVRDRKGVSTPRWSPDGASLAFLAEDPATKQDQIFVLPLDGGDAARITDNAQGVDDYAWSPDGRQLAFVAEDAPIRADPGNPHNKVFRVTDGHFLLDHEVAPWHLWVIPSSGGTARRLTQGAFSLGTESGSVTTPAWSPDGRRIAFTRYEGPYWATSFRSTIGEVDVASGEVRILVEDSGAGSVSWAMDGDAVAFRRPRGGDQNNGAAVYVRTQGRTFDATAALERQISSYAWLPGGKALVASGPMDTHSVLWELPLAGKPRAIDLGDIEVNDGMGTTTTASASDLGVSARGMIAFIGSTSMHPGELYVLDSIGAKPRRLTNFNAFIGGLELGRTEAVDWAGPDGFHEDGVLTYPVGFVAGQRYPLVLMIHGGPALSSNQGFQRLAQLLAAEGFLVFQPNYRGSYNLGDAYQRAMYRDTGEGPGKDVMAGIEAVKAKGIVDDARIGVSGWSYGGYMTAWLTGHYDVWKAAVVGAPVTDWLMDYSISFYHEGDAYLFGTKPWTDAGWAMWREQSPIHHVRSVKAPTLIMGSVCDANVPLVNAYEWFYGLRDNGVPVEFYAYPISSHVPQDVVQVMDMYSRWVGWMRRHLH